MNIETSARGLATPRDSFTGDEGVPLIPRRSTPQSSVRRCSQPCPIYSSTRRYQRILCSHHGRCLPGRRLGLTGGRLEKSCPDGIGMQAVVDEFNDERYVLPLPRGRILVSLDRRDESI
jgi:hypothetical protein